MCCSGFLFPGTRRRCFLRLGVLPGFFLLGRPILASFFRFGGGGLFVIRLVKSSTLENKRGSSSDFALEGHFSASRALSERLGGDGLKSLQAMATVGAGVIVGWHGENCPEQRAFESI